MSVVGNIISDRLLARIMAVVLWFERTKAGQASPVASVRERSGLEVCRMVVTALHDDYLTCHTLTGAGADEAEGDVDILVAKPPDLRKTGWDGATVNGRSYVYASASERTSTLVADGSTEVQLVTPDYYVGAEIRAECDIRGGTGLLDGDGKLIVWEDVNRAGRAWSEP
jgi:hypothetical protein